MTETATRPDLLRGLLYAHNRANANTAELHEALSTVQALTDLLVEQGTLDAAELDLRKADAAQRLRGEFVERGMAVALQEFPVSKHEFAGGAEIDCESRIELCKAACCRLPLALSREDVEEGVLRWDLGQPYMLARDEEGYCVHLDRGSCRCGAYAHRPIPCRGYDCREDRRIWLDFERRVVNPELHTLGEEAAP